MTEQENAFKKIHVSSLDAIRGIGCFLVLLIHFRFTAANLPFTLALTALHAFFILSAFLITRNLLYERSTVKSFGLFFKRFYIKRTARIFPVYFFYIFVVIIVFAILKVAFNNDMNVFKELKHYGWMLFTFTYNLKMQIAVSEGYKDYFSCFLFPHLWSVALEEQFYLMVIFLLWICTRNQLKYVSILFMIAIPLIRIYGYYAIGEKTDDGFLRTLTLIHSPYYQFDSFFYGIAMAAFDLRKSKIFIYMFYSTLVILVGHTIVNSYLNAAADHVSIFKSLREDKYFYESYGIYFLDILMNLFSCAWIYCMLYFPEKFRLFSNRLIIRYGELSYGMYIFQFLVLGVGVILTAVLMKLGVYTLIAELAGFTVYLVLNYYLAVWINKRIERPVAAFKDRLLKRIQASNA